MICIIFLKFNSINLKEFDLEFFEKLKDSTMFNLKHILDLGAKEDEKTTIRHKKNSSILSANETRKSAFKPFKTKKQISVDMESV